MILVCYHAASRTGQTSPLSPTSRSACLLNVYVSHDKLERRTARHRTKLTPPLISQLCNSGVLPQPVQGKHDPFVAVPAYISFISQRLAGGDLKGARIAKYAVETALRELELKQKSGEVIDRSAVEMNSSRLPAPSAITSRTYRRVPLAWSRANAISNGAMTFWLPRCNKSSRG